MSEGTDMTWSLQASGHTPNPYGSDTDPAAGGPQPWADVEQALFDEIQAVLAKPEYGTSAAQFTGNYVAGEPYNAPKIDPPVIPALSDAEYAQLQDLLARSAARDQYVAQEHAAESVSTEPGGF